MVRAIDRGLPTGGIERIVCRLVPELVFLRCLSTIPRTWPIWNGVSWAPRKRFPPPVDPSPSRARAPCSAWRQRESGISCCSTAQPGRAHGPTGDLVVGVTCTSSSACTASTESGAVLTYNGAPHGRSILLLPESPSPAARNALVPTSGFCADVTVKRSFDVERDLVDHGDPRIGGLHFRLLRVPGRSCVAVN